MSGDGLVLLSLASSRADSPSPAGAESHRPLWVFPRAEDDLDREWESLDRDADITSGDLGFSFDSGLSLPHPTPILPTQLPLAI